MQTAIHTSRRGSRWVNTREGSTQILDTYDSQIQAATAGRRLARAGRVEHVSHRPDGSIDEITQSG